MSDEIDLSGEQDPEERMAMHEELNDRDGSENEMPSDAEHDGAETTEDFDVAEAIENL